MRKDRQVTKDGKTWDWPLRFGKANRGGDRLSKVSPFFQQKTGLGPPLNKITTFRLRYIGTIWLKSCAQCGLGRDYTINGPTTRYSLKANGSYQVSAEQGLQK